MKKIAPSEKIRNEISEISGEGMRGGILCWTRSWRRGRGS